MSSRAKSRNDIVSTNPKSALIRVNPRFQISLTIAFLVLLTLAGCKQTDRLYAYFQHLGPKLNISAGRMTMTMGDGAYDIRKAMAKQRYAGEAKYSRVTVTYLEGTKELAEKTAHDFDRMYKIVQERLGVEWAFDLNVRFVDSADVPQDGWHFSEKLRANRKLTFPVVVTGNTVDVAGSAVVAHEVTEASMLYPYKRKQTILGDAWLGDITISYHTRWFRDGLSDYAGNLFAREILGEEPPARADFCDLARRRGKILDWSNPDGDGSYPAALALVHEITFHSGEGSIPEIMREISKYGPAGGKILRRSVRNVTGMDLREYLAGYRMPWLGFSASLSSDKNVTVRRIWKGTPAHRWRLKIGDVIRSIDTQRIDSPARLDEVLARMEAGQRLRVEVERGGESHVYNMKTISYPPDISLFESYTSYRPGSALKSSDVL